MHPWMVEKITASYVLDCSLMVDPLDGILARRGITLTVLSYIVCLMFIRIKMPNYMR
jgi:hypothetical protein